MGFDDDAEAVSSRSRADAEVAGQSGTATARRAASSRRTLLGTDAGAFVPGVGQMLPAVITDDGRAVVHVTGALDVHTVDARRAVLLEVVAAGFLRIVVVLTGVTSVDSTGFGMLVGAHKLVCTRGGRLQLVVDQERLLRIIRISALDRVLVLHPTLDAALEG